jgi:dihydroorotate dehydrogenase
VVRELVTADTQTPAATTGLAELQQAAQRYLKIEHGGGAADAEDAFTLFVERASLLAVGSAPQGEEPSAW